MRIGACTPGLEGNAQQGHSLACTVDKAVHLPLQGEQAWRKCKEGKNWSLLLGVLITSYFYYVVGSVLLHLVSTGAGFAFPILLEYITNYLELCGAEAVRSISDCC